MYWEFNTKISIVILNTRNSNMNLNYSIVYTWLNQYFEINLSFSPFLLGQVWDLPIKIYPTNPLQVMSASSMISSKSITI